MGLGRHVDTAGKERRRRTFAPVAYILWRRSEQSLRRAGVGRRCGGTSWCWRGPTREKSTASLEAFRDDLAFGARSVADESEAAEKFGTEPNQRLYRPDLFRVAFCEQDKPARRSSLRSWPPINGETARSTVQSGSGLSRPGLEYVRVDSDRDQILLWGGGHCVRSSSTVLHYSPVSGRIVEALTRMNRTAATARPTARRPTIRRSWVGRGLRCITTSTTPTTRKCKLLVSARGLTVRSDPNGLAATREI